MAIGGLAAATVAVAQNDIWRIDAPGSRVECAAIAADGSRAVLGLADGRVLVRSLADDRTLHVYDGGMRAVSGAAISADGARAAWIDRDGGLHGWAETTGVKSVSLSTSGLTGVALTANGAQAIAGGDGTAAFYRDAASLASVKMQNLGLEQIQSVGASADGATVALGDHSGRVALIRRSGSLYSSTTRSVSTEGIRFIEVLPGSGGEIVCVDDASVMRFLNATSLIEQGTLALGDVRIRAMARAADGARLLLGTEDGQVLEVAPAARTARALDYALGEPVVALWVQSGDSEEIITGSGARYRAEAGVVTRVADALAGPVTQVAVSLATGDAAVVCDSHLVLLGLGDGTADAIDSIRHVLDVAEDFSMMGPGLSVLYLDEQGYHLSPCGTAERHTQRFDFDGIAPVRIAGAQRRPWMAAADSDGAVVLLHCGADDVWRQVRAWPAMVGQLWSGLAFTRRDAKILQWGARMLRVLDPVDGGALAYTMASTDADIVQVCEGPGGVGAWVATGEDIRRFDLVAQRLEHVWTASAGERIVAMSAVAGTRLMQVRTDKGGCVLDVDTGVAQPDDAVATGAFLWHAAVDGPFALGPRVSGELALESVEQHALIAAFPNLRPRSFGGMDTGDFGVIRDTFGEWFDHEDYGVGLVRAIRGNRAFWFPGEKWLIGDPSHPAYLFSPSTSAWMKTLYPTVHTGWTFDYALSGWRYFGD